MPILTPDEERPKRRRRPWWLLALLVPVVLVLLVLVGTAVAGSIWTIGPFVFAAGRQDDLGVQNAYGSHPGTETWTLEAGGCYWVLIRNR